MDLSSFEAILIAVSKLFNDLTLDIPKLEPDRLGLIKIGKVNDSTFDKRLS